MTHTQESTPPASQSDGPPETIDGFETGNSVAPNASQSEALAEYPKCERGGEDCGEHAPTWMDLALYWKAQCEASRAREASVHAEGRREGIEEAADHADRWNTGIGDSIRALAEKRP